MNMTINAMDSNHTNGTTPNQGEYSFSEGVKIFYMIGSSLCFIVSLAIIVVNALYIVCLYINRKKQWFAHSKNILSIVCIDLMVGISSMWLTLTLSMPDVNFYTCALSQSLCLSAQITTSLSILRLCVLRIISVRRTVPGQEPTARSIILQTLLTYTLSSVLCFTPMFIWGKYSRKLQRCAWSEIFRENTLKVDKFMLTVLLVPTLLTTTFYIFLSLYIRKKQSAIFPGARPERGREMAVWNTEKKNTTTTDAESTRADGTTTIGIANAKAASESVTHDNITSHARPSDATSSYDDATETGQGTSAQHTKRGGGLTRKAPTSRSHETARQRRLASVMKTIGAILVCANASVLPYVVLLVLKIANWPAPVNPFYGFLTSFCLMLNSIADPLIYAITLKHLRVAFRNLLSKYLPCVHS